MPLSIDKLIELLRPSVWIAATEAGCQLEIVATPNDGISVSDASGEVASLSRAQIEDEEYMDFPQKIRNAVRERMHAKA